MGSGWETGTPSVSRGELQCEVKRKLQENVRNSLSIIVGAERRGRKPRLEASTEFHV